jgi:hypothetical protein
MGLNQFANQPLLAVPVNLDAATAVDRAVWACPSRSVSYKLVGYTAVWGTAGGSSAAVRPRKCTGTSASGAAAGATVIEQSAAVDLTATADTVTTPALTATDAGRTFLPGDRLCLDFSGTQTGLVGLNMIFYFTPAGSRL